MRHFNSYRCSKGKTKPPVSALFYPLFSLYLWNVKMPSEKNFMTHNCSSKENPVLAEQCIGLNSTAPGEETVSWSIKRYWAEVRPVFGCYLLQPCCNWAVYFPETVPLIRITCKNYSHLLSICPDLPDSHFTLCKWQPSPYLFQLFHSITVRNTGSPAPAM